MKAQKRAENEYDRNMRDAAKAYFMQHVGRDPALLRPKITDIKKILISLDSHPTVEIKDELNERLQIIVGNAKALLSKAEKAKLRQL